jgi:serine/threonine protein kinase
MSSSPDPSTLPNRWPAASVPPPDDRTSDVQPTITPPTPGTRPTLPRADDPAPAAAAPPGYKIEAELGRGGMGVVYLARHAALGRRVALKVILAGGHARTDELTRFRQEAAAAAKLQHPNVVQVYEVGEFEGRPYFTLEYVEGGSLGKYAKDPLPPREAAGLMEQVARGVAFAHANGVIHRDLKPDNVLLQMGDVRSAIGDLRSGPAGSKSPFTNRPSSIVPKVTDFGLAKTLDSKDGLTATGAVMGTPS